MNGLGWSRYMEAVQKKGFSWYEGEVHPKIVNDLMPFSIHFRSYQMPKMLYKQWLDQTGMDMIYGYVPWFYGRENTTDEFGCFQYKKPLANVGDLIDPPPYDAIKSRAEELCSIKDGRGVEFALYNTPMIVLDALGLEKFAIEMMDHPAKLEDWMDRIDERVARELEVILEYPVEVIQITQIFADKNGPLFGAEQLDRFGFQYLNRRSQRISTEGRLLSIHCDGDCRKLYGRIERLANVFNGYEGTDFARDLAESKMGFRGSVPTSLLANGTPETIEAHVKELKKGTPHVIGSTHDTGDVPIENFMAMMEAARG